MKLYTYIDDELIEIKDVTICLETEEDLLKINKFFKTTTNFEFEHIHYKDFIEDDYSSDIILFNKINGGLNE